MPASAQLPQCMADNVWCVQETWDILCLLVMIRINYHHQLIMNKRRIPCLDDYLDRINLTLWPRFKVPETSPQCRSALYCSQAYLSLDFHCGIDFLKQNRRFRIGKS